MNFKEISESKVFRAVLYVIGVVVVLLLVFHAGMSMGYRRALFSTHYGQNYYNNFAEPRRGFMREFDGGGMMNSHGVAGAILKVDADNLMIKGHDGQEKLVILTEKTQIMDRRNQIKVVDLKVGEEIVVIGAPNDKGQVEAKLIRVLPEPQFQQKPQSGLLKPMMGGYSQTQQ